VRENDGEIRHLHESIQLYKKPTRELILEYLSKRHEEQRSCEKNSIQGVLTVIGNYEEESETLEVNVLNAALNILGDINSYVRFQIYTNSPNGETAQERQCSKVVRNTQYPLFQQQFNM